MKIGNMFSGSYLKASDLDGDEIKTIDSVSTVSLKDNQGQETHKPVLHFKGQDLGLVLNKTNAKAIARALGSDETDDWLGRKITLYTTEVEFRGDWVDAIRVKPKAPKESEPTDSVSDDISDDDMPF